jgi:hypothetical protein
VNPFAELFAPRIHVFNSLDIPVRESEQDSGENRVKLVARLSDLVGKIEWNLGLGQKIYRVRRFRDRFLLSTTQACTALVMSLSTQAASRWGPHSPSSMPFSRTFLRLPHRCSHRLHRQGLSFSLNAEKKRG